VLNIVHKKIPKNPPLKKTWRGTLAFSLVVLSMASLSSTVMSSTFPFSGFRFPSLVDSRGKFAPKKLRETFLTNDCKRQNNNLKQKFIVAGRKRQP
jgi:hypothetical protein